MLSRRNHCAEIAPSLVGSDGPSLVPPLTRGASSGEINGCTARWRRHVLAHRAMGWLGPSYFASLVALAAQAWNPRPRLSCSYLRRGLPLPVFSNSHFTQRSFHGDYEGWLADYAMSWKGGCCFRPFSNPSTIFPAGRRIGAWGGESSLKVRVKRSGTWSVVLALSGKRGSNSAVVLSLFSGWLTGIAWMGTIT